MPVPSATTRRMTPLEEMTYSDGFRVCLLHSFVDRANSRVGYAVCRFDGGRLVARSAHDDYAYSPASGFYRDLRTFLMSVLPPPHVLVVCGRGWRELLRHALPARIREAFRVLDLSSTVRAMEPSLPARAGEDRIRAAFGLNGPCAADDASAFQCELLWAVLAKAGNAGLDWAGLLGLPETTMRRLDFERYAFSPEYLASLPQLPAVYTMRDAHDRVLYIGKTCNLARRMGEYFRGGASVSGRVARIRDDVHDIEFELVSCELEAVVLEYRRIEQMMPRVNVQRKVAEGRGRYGRRLAPVVVVQLASDGKGGIEVFGLSEGDLLQLSLGPRNKWRARIERLIEELQGRRRMRSSRHARRWGGEGCELAWRYFMRYRGTLQWCEVTGTSAVTQGVERVLSIAEVVASSSPEPGEFRFEGGWERSEDGEPDGDA